MKKITNYLLFFVVAATFVSCGNKETSKYDRPLDNWVFRSVMDSIPRIVTAALHDDVWLSYSAEDGTVYKAWDGTVNFDGAVFTTAHGPQPTSIGDAWFINTIKKPWSVEIGGKAEEPKVSYKGHRFVKEQVEFMYELTLSNGKSIKVFEKPEAIIKDAARGLERTFTLENAPKEVTVFYELNLSSIASESSVTSDGTWTQTSSEKRKAKGLSGFDVVGKLTLNNDKSTTLTAMFTSKPLIIDTRNENAKAEEEEIPLGAKLIAKTDCPTCHNTYNQTVGPSYIDIAKRYETLANNVTMLTNKVIVGGSGTWGEAAMTAHPDLDKTDVTEMVKYILSLDADEEAKGAVGGFKEIPAEEYRKADVAAAKKSILPGALAKAYVSKKALSVLADMNWAAKPDFGGTVSKIHAYAEDFKELTEDFAMTFEGYLNIEEAGVYVLRLGSDDGSRLLLGKDEVINHDGLHGGTFKDMAVGLEKGLHPFKIEFFQGKGGRAVSFQYRGFDQSEFVVVPSTVMVQDAERQSEILGLKMPLNNENALPGDKMPVAGVHPSFDLTQARPSSFLPKVGGMAFTADGKMVVCTWEATGSVYILSNLDQKDPEKIVVKRIAKGLAEPLGIQVVDGDIYVLQKQELTRLVDTDGDEIIDEYQTVSNQWKVSSNFHEFNFGLLYKEGYFYGNLSTGILPGGASAKQVADRGKTIKISKKDGSVEFLTSGLRTPNGIGFGYKGEMFVADNQGDWLPASKIVHVTKGAWYGSRSVDFEGTANLEETLPVVWLPQDEIGNSPSQPGILKQGIYKDQMIHGEVTHGGLKRVFVEEINGKLQGGVFRFTQGIEAGVNRIAWDNKGENLYIGGIGNPGNWQHSGTQWYGLQRFSFNGKSTFEMLAVRAKSNGVEIEFTEPIANNYGNRAEDYDIKQWYYKPTENYGGPKMDETKLAVKSVNVSKDRKKVFLELGGMKAKHVVYVHLAGTFISQKNQELWSTECWYTMNAIPKNAAGFSNPTIAQAPNTLSEAEKADGWKLLFNGKNLDGWRNFRKETIGSAWKVEDNAIALTKAQGNDGWQVKDGGDIITDKDYQNYELSIEWKIQNCGNSGIIFNVFEDKNFDYVWQTGPEMQVLDNLCHPDSRIRTHRAGDLYDMIECNYVTVKPAGEWNQARLIIKNGKTEHWLNGRKVVEYEMFTKEWEAMIAKSKFKDMKGFGTYKKGHIALQDHGDLVWYRNIKIKEF
jgi:cytochrome c